MAYNFFLMTLICESAAILKFTQTDNFDNIESILYIIKIPR